MKLFQVIVGALLATSMLSGCASEELHVLEVRRDLEAHEGASVPVDQDGAYVVDPLQLAGAEGTVISSPAFDEPMLMVDVEKLPPLTSVGWEYRVWFLPEMSGKISDVMLLSNGAPASITLEPDDMGHADGMLAEPMRVMDWSGVRGVWVSIELQGASLPAQDPAVGGEPANLVLIGVEPSTDGTEPEEGGGGHQH